MFVAKLAEILQRFEETSQNLCGNRISKYLAAFVVKPHADFTTQNQGYVL